MKVNIQFILDFGPWKWSALNLGYMDKQPSRMQALGQGQGVRRRSGIRPGSKQARVGGAEALAFSVLPLPTALTRATLIGGI